MSALWTTLGTVAQLSLGMFLFMLAVFVGAGIANGKNLGAFDMGVLNASMFGLPGTCALSAGIVLLLHYRGSGPASYGWHALPVVVAVLYLLYAVTLSRRSER